MKIFSFKFCLNIFYECMVFALISPTCSLQKKNPVCVVCFKARISKLTAVEKRHLQIGSSRIKRREKMPQQISKQTVLVVCMYCSRYECIFCPYLYFCAKKQNCVFSRLTASLSAYHCIYKYLKYTAASLCSKASWSHFYHVTMEPWAGAFFF